MSVYYTDDRVSLYHGDCIEVMRQLPDNSVDAVVTDPPYGLEFMGKGWDAPWQSGVGVGEHNAGFSAGAPAVAGVRGAIKALPSFTGSTNPTCANCGGTRNGNDRQSRKRCRCDNPIFPNTTLPRMIAFEQWCNAWATEALRVLKPGGHLLAFGGTRTWHRLAVAIEDAGFEVRDSIAWMYGSGFPKSLDVSKAIDKSDAKDEQQQRRFKFTAWVQSQGVTAKQIDEATGTFMGNHYTTHPTQPAVMTREHLEQCRHLFADVPRWVELECDKRSVESKNFASREVVGTRLVNGEHGTAGGYANGIASHNFDITITRNIDITAPATPAAQQWQGWGTALKPAHEPIVVARKPLIGTVAENVLTHGTGALNIDGCRIAGEPWAAVAPNVGGRSGGVMGKQRQHPGGEPHTAGRWPANVILDESQAAELDAQSGVSTSVGVAKFKPRSVYNADAEGYDINGQEIGYGDTGGASRFFYVAKAGKKERPNVNGVAHPTVKPMALMQYLVRLVTPPGGTVLEPFAGSGTTIEAALEEGFNVIGIEMTDEYLPLILARIERYGEKLC